MAEIKQVFELASLPGIKRDGTMLDGDHYSDGQWVRFQRGRPRSIGGHKELSRDIQGEVYSALVYKKAGVLTVLGFSTREIAEISVSSSFASTGIGSRYPTGVSILAPSEVLWSVDAQFDAAAGSEDSLVLALPADNLTSLDGTTERKLYVANTNDSSLFYEVSDVNAMASGGVYVCHPYTVLYGNAGKVTWSNANEPQNMTTGEAGTTRVTDAKIVKGLSLRSGSGASGLLWSLNSVIKQEWIGGDSIFRFSTISRNSSILSANCVVDYDGTFFWVGVDRFYVSDGNQVSELPNDLNFNWFFDSLNQEHATKVFAVKNTRFGEIWWYFPKDAATECSHAIIYNVREKTWYDTENRRSAGFQGVVSNPVLFGRELLTRRTLTVTAWTGTPPVVGSLVTDGVSSTYATVVYISGNTIRVRTTNDPALFTTSNTIINATGTVYWGTAEVNDPMTSIIVHELGVNHMLPDESEESILSHVTSSDIGLPTGGTAPSSGTGLNRWTRLVRVEPDFILGADATLEILGREFANTPEVTTGPFTFDDSTTKIDMRTQHRHIRLKFSSSSLNGSFQMGRVLLHTEPGDIRN